MAPVMAVAQGSRVAEKLRRELGQLILARMEDPRTEDIVLNADGLLWVFRLGEGFVQVGQMSEDQAYSVVGTIASCRQTVINHDHAILETELSLNGARFEALVPDVVTRPVFAMR